jgi:hypothetical protein
VPSEELSQALTQVEWANQEVQDLNAAIGQYAATKPYALVVELNAKTGLYDTLVRSTGPIAPGVLKCTTQAVAHLWSALDYLAAALAKKNRHDPRGAFFPVAENRHRFIDAEYQRKRKRYFGETAAKMLDRLEPYRGGKGAFLYSLRELNKPSKHERFMTVGDLASGVHIKHLKVESFGPFTIPNPSAWGSLEEGIVLFSGVKDQYVEHEIEVPVSVAFRETGLFKNQPVVPVLVQLVDGVKRVLETFDAAVFLEE